MDVDNQAKLRRSPSNGKTAILFAAMAVWFVIGGSRYLDIGGLLWLGLTLVGLAGAVVYGAMLLPGSSYLEADADGMTVCTAFRKRSYDWADIHSFSADTILSRQVVKYRLHVVDGEERHDRDETLPDTYGLSPDELADRLNGFRRRYAIKR